MHIITHLSEKHKYLRRKNMIGVVIAMQSEADI